MFVEQLATQSVRQRLEEASQNTLNKKDVDVLMNVVNLACRGTLYIKVSPDHSFSLAWDTVGDLTTITINNKINGI